MICLFERVTGKRAGEKHRESSFRQRHISHMAANSQNLHRPPRWQAVLCTFPSHISRDLDQGWRHRALRQLSWHCRWLVTSCDAVVPPARVTFLGASAAGEENFVSLFPAGEEGFLGTGAGGAPCIIQVKRGVSFPHPLTWILPKLLKAMSYVALTWPSF